ncbi:MAG: hypothetical protein ACRD4Q_00125 [Candidatus Acidiferrales bacterium]
MHISCTFAAIRAALDGGIALTMTPLTHPGDQAPHFKTTATARRKARGGRCAFVPFQPLAEAQHLEVA